MVDDRVLRSAVAFGPERTMEQDPLFAFRILVDIALKALSPAINDPTTGVIALDQIQRLLRVVGRRHLRGEAIFDSTGQQRVIFRTPELGCDSCTSPVTRSGCTVPATCRSRGACARCSTT